MGDRALHFKHCVSRWLPIVPRAWRIGLLLVLLAWLRSPGLLVVTGPPRAVETRHPIVCTHTRLTDEVEPWKVQRTLQMVREMGAPQIVEYFPWAYVEPHEDEYHWAHSDLVMEHASAQGLTVIARLGLVPEWARPETPAGEPLPVDSYLDPERYADFAGFVKDFVSRYGGTVHAVVIWNEPNLALEWGFQPVDPPAYVRLLRLAYAAAKAANPDVLVLAAALAPTVEPDGSPNGMNDLAYLERMYAAGLADVADGLALHSYGLGQPPSAAPGGGVLNYRHVELQRAIMEAHGDGDKPAYVTESGWNDSPRWTFGVSPGVRIRYTLESYAWAEQHWPWVQAVCTWAFRYPAPTFGYYDNYTFVASDFEPKPIYYAVQEWARASEQ